MVSNERALLSFPVQEDVRHRRATDVASANEADAEQRVLIERAGKAHASLYWPGFRLLHRGLDDRTDAAVSEHDLTGHPNRQDARRRRKCLIRQPSNWLRRSTRSSRI